MIVTKEMLRLHEEKRVVDIKEDEAMRRDAERYRWLRNRNACADSPDEWTITRCDFTDEDGPHRYWVGSDLDTAIDAAMNGANTI